MENKMKKSLIILALLLTTTLNVNASENTKKEVYSGKVIQVENSDSIEEDLKKELLEVQKDIDKDFEEDLRKDVIKNSKLIKQ